MHRGHVDHQLASIPLFQSCSTHDLKKFDSLMTKTHVKAGHVLMREGEIGHELLIIVEGTADVTIGDRVVRTLGPGDFVGEISVLAGGPRTATVTATSDLVVEALTGPEFTMLLAVDCDLTRRILKGLAERLRDADLRLRDAHASVL